MAKHAGRRGDTWRRVQAQVFASESHCWLCGGYVDQALPPNDRMARSVDHVIPLERGGAPYARSNLRLAHRRCNSSKADGIRLPANAPPSGAWRMHDTA